MIGLADCIVGITTTVPIEIIYAAGYIPCDLNNLFITSPDRDKYIEIAHRDGFPTNICTWIKGIYGAVIFNNIKKVILVVEGDCANTKALGEHLQEKGVEIIPFSYPYQPDPQKLKNAIEEMMNFFGVSYEKVKAEKIKLDNIRNIIEEIDLLTYKENKVSGKENHLWLVNCSDFERCPQKYYEKALNFVEEAKKRKSFPQKLRLGYIGVPPIFEDIYDIVEEYDARIVFNEVQRQFAMLFKTQDIIEQYTIYTYPYPVKFRIKDIITQIKERKIHGLIHYVQSFCYRILLEPLLKKHIPIPILTIEGESQYNLDARLLTRLECFLEMLNSSIS